MKCPHCGLVIWRFWYPVMWENHMMVHEIFDMVSLLSGKKLREEEVKNNAGN